MCYVCVHFLFIRRRPYMPIWTTPYLYLRKQRVLGVARDGIIFIDTPPRSQTRSMPIRPPASAKSCRCLCPPRHHARTPTEQCENPSLASPERSKNYPSPSRNTRIHRAEEAMEQITRPKRKPPNIVPLPISLPRSSL